MKFTTLLIALVIGSPVFGTGCYPGNPTESALFSYKMAQEASEDYTIVAGSFQPSRLRPRQGTFSNGLEYLEWQGRFSGYALGNDGFTQSYNHRIRFIFACDVYAGCHEWRSMLGVLPEGQVLAFIKTTGGRRVLATNECSSFVDSSEPSVLGAVQQCHLTGRCG